MSEQTTPKFPLYHLPPQALATVLVALGDYVKHREEIEKQTNLPGHRYCETPFGTLAPLYANEAVELMKSLQHTGLTFAEVVPMFAESSEDSPYVRAARESAEEGEFEVDDPAVVSHGDDDGAYVMGWTWISDAAAGVKTYWTIQIGGGPDMPLHEGGSGPDEPVWYFEYEDDFTRACDYCAALGLPFTKDIASKVPEDDFTSDFGEFKEYADLQAKEDSHG